MSYHVQIGKSSGNSHDFHAAIVLEVPKTNFTIARIGIELEIAERIEETAENSILMANLENKRKQKTSIPKCFLICMS